jgi:hypothetical protein
MVNFCHTQRFLALKMRIKRISLINFLLDKLDFDFRPTLEQKCKCIKKFRETE